MKTQTKKRLLDALTACQAIESFVADHSYDSVDNELLWQTIQHNIPPLRKHLEIILEAK